jgi:hypothetical protein
MIPDGFRWAPRYQYAQGDNGLFIAGELVAYMNTRTDGEWLARLDVHHDGTLITRRCTDWERGRAGCEAWARRHESRLRRETEAKAATRPCLRWQGQSGAGGRPGSPADGLA